MPAALIRSLALALPVCAFALAAPAQVLRESHALIPASAFWNWSPVLADVTGDGHMDLLVCPVELLVGRGDGGFETQFAELPPMLSAQPYWAILSADTDADGDLDLFALGGPGGLGLVDRLFSNEGGHFEDVGHIHPTGVSWSADVGDVNGDARPDILMARSSSQGSSTLYLGRADGFAHASDRLPSGLIDTVEVHLVDVDLDRDLDAFVRGRTALGQPIHVALWTNDGSGSFKDASERLPLDSDPTVALAVGDLDRVAGADLFVVGSPSRLWLNDGSGYFIRRDLDEPRDNGYVGLVDLEPDGDLDALLETSSGAHLYLNDGLGHLSLGPEGQFSIGPSAQRVLLADLDGDRDADATLLGRGFFSDRILLGDGVGGFHEVVDTGLPLAPDYPFRIEAGDLDADGDMDLVVSSRHSPVRVAWNLGHGGFGPLEDLSFQGQAPLPLVVDFDEDGDEDLFIGKASKNALLLNQGCGALVDGSDRLPVETVGALGAAAGDLDGDGHVDLYLGHDQRDGILYGMGGGVYEYWDQAAPKYKSKYPTTAIALGDLDGDGDLDAFTGSDPWGRPRIAINQGDRTFLLGPGLPGKQEHQSVGDVAMLDVEGDGDLDLLLVTTTWSQTPTPNDLWINQGGLVFTNEGHRLPPEADDAWDLATADFDQDGDVDLYVTNANGSDSLLLNDGIGFFAPAGAPQLRLPKSLLTVSSDVDGDADPDVVTLTRDWLHVLFNHTHQLSWARLPRLGEGPAMRVNGTPGESYLVVASSYANPTACGFGAVGERRVVAEGAIPGSGEVLLELGEPDTLSTLWRVFFTGPAGRVAGNYELTVRRAY